MSSLSDYPDVAEAFDAYVASQNTEPKDATQLTRWAKRYAQKNLVYSHVNKFLRLKRGQPAETRKAIPPKARSYNRLPQTRSRPQSVVSRNGSSNSVFNPPTRDRGFTAPSRKSMRDIRPKSPPVRKEIQQRDRPKRVGDLATVAQHAEVRDEEEKTTANATEENGDTVDAASSASEEKARSVQMNRAEDQAVSRLTSAIKSHTVAIQKLEPNVADVRNEAQSLRREIEERFESIRSALEVSKAQLVKNLTLAESDAVNKVQAELGSVKQSAGNLLKCHKEVTAPLSEAVDDEERRQRAQFVVTKITEALTDAPSSSYEHHLLFQTEDVNFEELFANFGKIIIQRKKIRAGAGPE